jgi:hypothetical protein
MQKFRFRHNSPAKVAKDAKATVYEGSPVANQMLRVANDAGADNENTETLADISRPLASQETCKTSNISEISRISSISHVMSEKNDPPSPPVESKGIEKADIQIANPEPPAASLPGIWHPWRSSDSDRRNRTPETCPARCKKTGQCYQQAYFTAKPGPFPGPECDTVSSCVWLEKNQYHK